MNIHVRADDLIPRLFSLPLFTPVYVYVCIRIFEHMFVYMIMYVLLP